MRQRDADAALIDQADVRKMDARRGLDVVDGATRLPCLEEDAVAVAASASMPAASSGAPASVVSHGSTRSGITLLAIACSIDETRDCSTGIGHPDEQHMPLSRQA